MVINSTLVHTIAWCHHARSHYLSHCWLSAVVWHWATILQFISGQWNVSFSGKVMVVRLSSLRIYGNEANTFSVNTSVKSEKKTYQMQLIKLHVKWWHCWSLIFYVKGDAHLNANTRRTKDFGMVRVLFWTSWPIWLPHAAPWYLVGACL